MKTRPYVPQLALFDQQGQATKQDALRERFVPGAIVCWPQRAFQQFVPFWQVRGSMVHDGRLDWYVMPVPYGENPGHMDWIYGDAPALDTGLVWRVPDYDEIKAWSQNAARRAYPEHLDAMCRCGASFLAGTKQCGYEPSDQWHHRFYAPYAEEAELVALLEPLGDRTHWTVENVREKLALLTRVLEAVPV